MADYTGDMKKYTVTDPQGNTYTLDPVDSQARQEIEEAKNLQFDEDYFTAEEDNVNGEVNIGLNGVQFGVDETLRFVQDSQDGIVIGINSDVSDVGKVLTVDNTGKAAWEDAPEELPASTSSDEDKVLAVDDQGTPVWKAFENDVFGTQLLDEHDQPVLDEESTPDNPIYVYDANSTDQLWTGFSGKGFGAIRAYADQDGYNIKATYLKKDDLPEMDEATDTEIDNMFTVVIGGRTYRTVTIGNQEWLAENLDYKFDYNGSQLPVGESGVINTPAAWYYNNDETNYGIDGTYKCGLLYNRYAVIYLHENKDTLLPDGWHVPSGYEWETMWAEIGERIGNVGSRYNCGLLLRASDGSVTSNWPSGWSGTDNYGFTVLPAGRYLNSTFIELGTSANFWTKDYNASSGASSFAGFGVGVDADTPEQCVVYGTQNMGEGFSLRLVRTIS